MVGAAEMNANVDSCAHEHGAASLLSEISGQHNLGIVCRCDINSYKTNKFAHGIF